MIRLRPSGFKSQVSGLLCALSLALFAGCASPASAQQALKVDPDTGQLVEPTTLQIGANQTLTTSANATVRLPAITGPVSLSGNFTLSGFGDFNEGAVDLRNYAGGYYRFKAGDNYLTFIELDSAKENATDLGGFDYSNDYTRFKVGGLYPGKIALWDSYASNYFEIGRTDDGYLKLGNLLINSSASSTVLEPPLGSGRIALTPETIWGNFTARMDQEYVIVDNATVTDPAASPGKGYKAVISAGTYTTPRGTYSVRGTVIHSLVEDVNIWTDYVTQPYSGGGGGGNLTVSQGGTGQTTLTTGRLLTGNGTGPVTLIAPGTTGNVLTSNGTAWLSQAPSGGGGGNITINTTAPLTVNGNSTATTSNATLAISAATTTTSGTVPTLGSATDRTGSPTRRQLLLAASSQFINRVTGGSLSAAVTSGTGTSASVDSAGNVRLLSTTSAGARAATGSGAPFGVWNGNYNVADWGQPLTASGMISIDHGGTAASDTRIRAGLGKAGATLGQIAARGYMVEVQWTGSAWEVFCAVHNGTTLNIQTTGITFATRRSVLWAVEADGTGNAIWYISVGGSAAPYNGQARTTATLTQTGAPTGTEATTRFAFVELNNGASGGANLTVDFTPMIFAFGL